MRRFTPEQAVWLRTLWPTHGSAETARLMNAWFGESFTAREIAMGAGHFCRWLTPEIKAWLREHITEKCLADTTADLNRAFDLSVTVDQLKNANSVHKFGKVPRNIPRPYQRLFSEDEKAWLREHYPKRAPSETLVLFNERWGRSITRGQLHAAQQRYKLPPSPYDGKIRPGDPRCGGWGPGGALTPEHKAAFLEGGKATRFKKGSVPPNHVPLWSERMTNHRVPYLEIKVPGPSPNPRSGY